MFITDYHRINHQLVRKPYLLPRIGDKIHQLEGFQYTTILNPNMGYYTIRLFPASQEITMIVPELDKFKCNRLPMGMCAPGDILQAKVYNLLGDIEGVKHIDR